MVELQAIVDDYLRRPRTGTQSQLSRAGRLTTYAKTQLRLYVKSVYEVVREPLLFDCVRRGGNYVRCDVGLDTGSRQRCGRASLREIGST